MSSNGKMSYEDALDFFARYGNVAADPDRLKTQKPTFRQLQEAVYHATNPPNDQPIEVAEAALTAICDHYNGEIS